MELDDGNIYKQSLYFMVKTMVSRRFSLELIDCKPGCQATDKKHLGVDQISTETGRTSPNVVQNEFTLLYSNLPMDNP